MPTHTPLHAIHASLGAVFTEFAGWSMPLRYGSEILEHHAVRTTAGLFDLTHMGEIEVNGAGAGAALDYALVGKASEISIGRAKYTMICQPDGGILDDLIVYRLGENRYLVVANAANVGRVTAELRQRSENYRAHVADCSLDWALLAIQGPRAAGILAALTEVDLTSLRYYAIEEVALAGATVLLARTGYTGEDGFEVFCAPDDAGPLWTSITAAGAPDGLVPAGVACRDSLRLEAGMPLYGHELGVRRTPYEAGLGRVVRLDKTGDFVGRDALTERHRTGTGSALVGLAADGRRAPRQGDMVLTTDAATVVGEVTSGAPSPTLGFPVAMAYVVGELSQTGTGLVVDVRGRHEPVTVVDLPFYRRTR